MMNIFDYQYLQTTYKSSLFEEVVDYSLQVPCTNCDQILDYIFRSYRFGDFLYITDIFPKIYENDSKCFQHIISREGYSVNMRRLSITCLFIFVQHFMSIDRNYVMVISGSYEIGEDKGGMSRKLKLYWYFFSPILDQLGLRAIDMFENNAFIVVSKENSLEDECIRLEYLKFKQQQS